MLLLHSENVDTQSVYGRIPIPLQKSSVSAVDFVIHSEDMDKHKVAGADVKSDIICSRDFTHQLQLLYLSANIYRPCQTNSSLNKCSS